MWKLPLVGVLTLFCHKEPNKVVQTVAPCANLQLECFLNWLTIGTFSYGLSRCPVLNHLAELIDHLCNHGNLNYPLSCPHQKQGLDTGLLEESLSIIGIMKPLCPSEVEYDGHDVPSAFSVLNVLVIQNGWLNDPEVWALPYLSADTFSQGVLVVSSTLPSYIHWGKWTNGGLQKNGGLILVSSLLISRDLK